MNSFYLPKKTKYKKFQKMGYRLKGLATGLILLGHRPGFFIKSLTSTRLKMNQVEAARRVLRRLVKKSGLISIPHNFDQSLTLKSSGVRMGKGKGAVSEWVSPINAGKLLIFVSNLNYLQANYSLKKARQKFAFKSKTFTNILFLLQNNLKNKYY